MKRAGFFLFILLCFTVANGFGQSSVNKLPDPNNKWSKDEERAIYSEVRSFIEENTLSKNQNEIKRLLVDNNDLRNNLSISPPRNEPVPISVIVPDSVNKLNPGGSFSWNKTKRTAIYNVAKAFRDADTGHKEFIAVLETENESFRILVDEKNKPDSIVSIIPPPPPNVNKERLVPITKEIIDLIEKEGLKLEDLHYYLSAPLQLVTNKLNSRPEITTEGRLSISETNDSGGQTLSNDIDNGDWGKLIQNTGIQKTKTSDGKEEIESFEISFIVEGRGIPMKFTRNNEKNRFDLYSAKYTDNSGTADYRLLPDYNNELPYLCIYSDHTTDNATVTLSNISTGQIKDLEDSLKDAKAELEQLEKERNTEVTALKEGRDTEIARLTKERENEVARLTKERDDANASHEQKIKQLEDMIKDLKNNIDDERGIGETVKLELTKLRLELTDLQMSNDNLSRALLSAESYISDLENLYRTTPRSTDWFLPERATNVKTIEGRGSVEKSNIVDYIRSKNSSVSARDVENLIDTYIREAQRENINYDIAIAQMCYATDYLKNRELTNAFNYADFAPVNRVAIRYSSMNEGVRAHIQHLKGYASRERPQGLVDKRYQILADERILGTAKTLDALYERWAPSNSSGYGEKINKILEELYTMGRLTSR